MPFFRPIISAALLAAMIAPGGVAAAGLAGGGPKKNDEPVLLIAKEVHYDEPSATATAIGDVEVIQGDKILRADRVVYYPNEDRVKAVGHVSILQPNGEVFFADDAELADKMERGAVREFKARLEGNALFAARSGQKLNKDVTVLKKLAYSPCRVCRTDNPDEQHDPQWQIRARKATIDQAEQRVYYRDAFVDVYGVPMLYTPYFSHPTPDAPSQSGVLTPKYFHATDLGNVVQLPVFLSLKPNLDVTLTPWYLSEEKPLLAGELRYLNKQSMFYMNGAITDTYERDAGGNRLDDTKIRGYISAHGRAHLMDAWYGGLDVERTTDNTFLQLYRFGWKDVLTSRLYAERIQGRNYALVESLAFQGLTSQDDSDYSPYILPQAKVHFESEPLKGGSRVTLDSSLLVTERSEGARGQRVSTQLGWKLPYITRGGQVFEASATLRGDAYNIDEHVPNVTTADTYDGTLGRVVPQLDVSWRYPLVKRFQSGANITLSPVAQVTLSPNLHPTPKIPNEDSLSVELNDINLFSADRFTGIDLVESGLRATYGARGQFRLEDEKYLEWLLGQTFQEYEDSPFPIASTTNPHFSDYIGHLNMKYKWFDLAYRFRMAREDLRPTSNQVNAAFVMSPFGVDVTYVSLRDDRIFGNRQEVFGSTFVDLSDELRWTMSARRDLGSNDTTTLTTTPVSTSILQPAPGTVGLGTSLTYYNECVMLIASAGRSYITQQDIRPSTTFSLQLTLKNFGFSETPARDMPSGAGTIATTSTLNAAGTQPVGIPTPSTLP